MTPEIISAHVAPDDGFEHVESVDCPCGPSYRERQGVKRPERLIRIYTHVEQA